MLHLSFSLDHQLCVQLEEETHTLNKDTLNKNDIIHVTHMMYEAGVSNYFIAEIMSAGYAQTDSKILFLCPMTKKTTPQQIEAMDIILVYRNIV